MTFKPIPSFPLYEVSDKGEVRNIETSTVLKPNTARRGGHRFVVLSQGSEDSRKNRYVHSLVLETFVGPRPEGLVCRHLDGDPNNNELSNLAYGSCAENCHDKIRHGNLHLAKLDERKVRIIRGLHQIDPEQFTQARLSQIFGVNQSCISRVIRRQRWAWVD